MHKPGKASSTWLGGRGSDTVFVRSLSPIAYVTRKVPPVLIIHGDADRTVPYEQSVLLFNALTKAGVKVQLYTAKGGTHSNMKPQDRAQIEKLISSFTDQLLK